MHADTDKGVEDTVEFVDGEACFEGHRLLPPLVVDPSSLDAPETHRSGCNVMLSTIPIHITERILAGQSTRARHSSIESP